MRTAFAETLCELAASDQRVWLLTGDLGFSVLEPFISRFPARFVNVGVAEQNLAGIAAGLASTGKLVFTYSIANFPTIRCLEQIRNDICYNNLPVRIVSVGGGFAYGPQGYTHHGLEDLAVMRSLPNMTVIAPGDPVETALATRALLSWPQPAYLRLGKAREPVVHTERLVGGPANSSGCHGQAQLARASQPTGSSSPEFALGKAILVRDGSDATLISTGGMLPEVVATADRLAADDHLHCRVLSMHTIKPLDVDAVRRAATETPAIVTVEEHSVVGALGSAVAEVLAMMDTPRARLTRFGAPDRLLHTIGSQAYLRSLCGDLPATVRSAVKPGQRPEVSPNRRIAPPDAG